jgi:hypothetical protein
MWTSDHRRAADRKGLRYAGDQTDREWALVEPLIPPAKTRDRLRAMNINAHVSGASRLDPPAPGFDALGRASGHDYNDENEWTLRSGRAGLDSLDTIRGSTWQRRRRRRWVRS